MTLALKSIPLFSVFNGCFQWVLILNSEIFFPTVVRNVLVDLVNVIIYQNKKNLKREDKINDDTPDFDHHQQTSG